MLIPHLERNFFKKEERLKSKKIISLLFKEGLSKSVRPLKCLYLEYPVDSHYPAQTGIAVSKRNIPRAVDRNKVKRLIRESFRLNKCSFYDTLNQKNVKLVLMFIFTGKEISTFKEIEVSMKKILADLTYSYE